MCRGFLEGARGTPPTELRDYMLVREFGYTKAQIEETPGYWLDWMLAIHGEATAVEQAAQERANRG